MEKGCIVGIFLYKERINYICNEPYLSRMLVECRDNEGKMETTTEGSCSQVVIPEDGRDIRVKFQNMHFVNIWVDIKKYDRRNGRWDEPTETHVFAWDKPVSRTFTLEGSLYYVAVMKVIDKYHGDEVDM